MTVVIVAHAAEDERHGIALLIQVHVPGVAFGGQLAHGLYAVAEVAGEGVGVLRGDFHQAYRRMVAQVVRRNRADQVAFHPQ
ncbi:hypothetical protein D3C84_1179410 [compost metagenome]